MVKYDVVFTASGELNADENWNLVQTRYPNAHRIDDMKSIYEAYRAASEISTEELVLIVDADNALSSDSLDIDNLEIDSSNPNFSLKNLDSDIFEPTERIKTLLNGNFLILWNATNGVNSIINGHGGLKLFKRKTHQNGFSGADVTNGMGLSILMSSQIASHHAFDYDEYNTWKTGFREGAKLVHSKYILGKQWLYSWTHEGFGRFGYAAKAGANQGATFSKKNSKGSLVMVNNKEFLKFEYEKWIKKGKPDE